MSPATLATHTIVIVGAGFIGLPVFNTLTSSSVTSKLSPDTNIDVVLVTPRPYFVHLPATSRLVTSPGENGDGAGKGGFVDEVLWPLTERFNVVGCGEEVDADEESKSTSSSRVKARTVIARVVRISPSSSSSVSSGNSSSSGNPPNESGTGTVHLSTGESIPYSVLLLAPGCSWSGPLNLPDTKTETEEHLKAWHARFESAQNIVLGGGGAVAFELAGELKDAYPSKQITIVHSKPLLLNEAYPDWWRARVGRDIFKRGVRLVLNDRLLTLDTPPEGGKVKTKAGLELDADLVVPTFGPRPNTSFLQEDVSPGFKGVLTEAGYIRTNKTLQVVGHPRVFAGGDALCW